MANHLELVRRCTGFQWDAMNVDKNWLKHRVTASEAEQVFFNRPLTVGDDPKHSTTEQRHFALGQTDAGRLLFIAFVVRDQTIRVVSARDMSKRERKVYLTS